MIHRNLDKNGDWEFGKGKQSYTKDLKAILLNINTRLKSWIGDSFRSPLEGVDYNNFLDKNTKSFLDSDVKRVILQSEGVIKITKYSSEINRSTRAFTANVELITIYGITRIEV